MTDNLSKFFAQPTGPRTVGDGSRDKGLVAPQQVAEKGATLPTGIGPVAPHGARVNTWTDPTNTNIHAGKIDPWVKPHGAETLQPAPQHVQDAVAAHLANLSNLDRILGRAREKLWPKHWQRRIGIANAPGSGNAAGLSAGTTGAATIMVGRGLVDMIHNPNQVQITVSLGELDGDPVPLVMTNIAAGGFADLPASGLLYCNGLTLLSCSLPITIAGRTLDA